MTINEAGKILKDALRYATRESSLEEHNALKLGIEALKRVRDNRLGPHVIVYQLLPGETEEIS